jgi:hypothetical protein
MVVDNASRRGRFRELMRRLCQSFFNKLVLLTAGRTRSLYAVVRHVGRRSGCEYRIPVLAHRAGRWFIVGLPYGEDVDWCRNVLAAARCVIEWRGSEYTATEPRILRLEVVGQRLSRRQRTFLTLIGVRRYLMLKASAPNT